MKKLFFAGIVAVSVVALAATPGQQEKKNIASNDNCFFQDTIPGKKKDTTKQPIPDSLGIAYSTVSYYDTIPKKDTTKKPIPDSLNLMAYNR